jgi:hypothetical protein
MDLLHIDTRNLPITILTSDDTKHRVNDTIARLREHGHSRFLILQGRKSNPYWMGLRSSVRVALAQPVPFIMLEDDATPHPENYTPIVSVPKNTDAVILGSAMAGWDPEKSHAWKYARCKGRFAALQYQDATPDYIRVGNMMYSHAELMITEHARKQYFEANAGNRERDLLEIQAQRATQTLAPLKTHYYQRDGRHTDITLAGITIDH